MCTEHSEKTEGEGEFSGNARGLCAPSTEKRRFFAWGANYNRGGLCYNKSYIPSGSNGRDFHVSDHKKLCGLPQLCHRMSHAGH